MFLEKRFFYNEHNTNSDQSCNTNTKNSFESEITASADDLESVSESETTDSTLKSKTLISHSSVVIYESVPDISKVNSRKSESCSNFSLEDVQPAIDCLAQSDINETVKDVVFEIVNRISKKFESSCCSLEDESRVKSNISDVSDVSERMDNEDDEVFTNALASGKDCKLVNEFNGQKLNEKPSTVCTEGELMKGKSQMSISVLKELKTVCAEIASDNVRLQEIISTFEKEYQQSVETVSVDIQYIFYSHRNTSTNSLRIRFVF